MKRKGKKESQSIREVDRRYYLKHCQGWEDFGKEGRVDSNQRRKEAKRYESKTKKRVRKGEKERSSQLDSDGYAKVEWLYRRPEGKRKQKSTKGGELLERSREDTRLTMWNRAKDPNAFGEVKEIRLDHFLSDELELDRFESEDEKSENHALEKEGRRVNQEEKIRMK